MAISALWTIHTEAKLEHVTLLEAGDRTAFRELVQPYENLQVGDRLNASRYACMYPGEMWMTIEAYTHSCFGS